MVTMPGSTEARGQSAEEHSARLRGLAWIDLLLWDEHDAAARAGPAGGSLSARATPSMSPAVKEAERLILSRRLAHDGSPVVRWCLSNVAIEQDAAGNVKISKARSREKVDGAVALAMAVGVAATEGRHTSVYAERPSFLFV
jgi:hypothetical protein